MDTETLVVRFWDWIVPKADTFRLASGRGVRVYGAIAGVMEVEGFPVTEDTADAESPRVLPARVRCRIPGLVTGSQPFLEMTAGGGQAGAAGKLNVSDLYVAG